LQAQKQSTRCASFRKAHRPSFRPMRCNVRVTAQLETAPTRASGQRFPAPMALSAGFPPGRYYIHSDIRLSSIVTSFSIWPPRKFARSTLRLEIQRVSENVVVTANAQPLDSRPHPCARRSHRPPGNRAAPSRVSAPRPLATKQASVSARTGTIGGFTTLSLTAAIPVYQSPSSMALRESPRRRPDLYESHAR